MVMEETPSPQCVGREFVRQYYTLLNKAPIHLHRFYNNVSSFVHGGLDAPDRETAPVIGQKEIHNRIQQLNFRDCHAKISQVDSQATLGNGVVVQVTGELSNGGQPMRRFTQTFVLAAQSPKQYYVHNDIFRYQDFVFSDDDGDWEYTRGGGGAAPSPPPPPPVPTLAPPPTSGQQQTVVVQQQQQPLVQQGPGIVVQQQGMVPQQQQQQQTVSGGGGVVVQQTGVVQQPPPASLPPPYFPPSPPPPQTMQMVHSGLNGHQEDQQREMEGMSMSMGMGESDTSCGDVEGSQEMEDEPERQPTPPPQHHQPAPVVVNTEPKTYANLVKSGPAFTQTTQHSTAQNVQVSSRPMGGSRGTESCSPPHHSMGGSPPAPNSAAPQHQRPRAPRTPRTDSTGDSGAVVSGGTTPPSFSSTSGRRYSDSHQLFLGNLPHSATKEELRALFEKFGPIAELRVHSKPAGSGPGGASGRVLPNYAFLTFEDAQSAQNCLSYGPLYYPSEDAPDAQQLNVQEKKSRPSGGGGGPGGPGRQGGGGGGSGGGPRSTGGPRPPRPPFQRGPYQPQRR